MNPSTCVMSLCKTCPTSFKIYMYGIFKTCKAWNTYEQKSLQCLFFDIWSLFSPCLLFTVSSDNAAEHSTPNLLQRWSITRLHSTDIYTGQFLLCIKQSISPISTTLLKRQQKFLQKSIGCIRHLLNTFAKSQDNNPNYCTHL